MYSIFEQLLQNRGWTPYEISKISGVSQATLSDWKNGKSVPRNKTLKKLADCFGVSVGYLKGDETEKAPDTEASRAKKHEEFIEILDSLPKEKQQAVLDYLRYVAGK